jgi:hypothetical protein
VHQVIGVAGRSVADTALALAKEDLVRLNNPWVKMTGRLSPVQFCGKFRWIFEQGNGLA